VKKSKVAVAIAAATIVLFGFLEGWELRLFGIYLIVGCSAGIFTIVGLYVYSDKIWIPATLREYLQATITSAREQLLSQTYWLPGNLQDTE
jgi:hypothetical protein